MRVSLKHLLLTLAGTALFSAAAPASAQVVNPNFRVGYGGFVNPAPVYPAPVYAPGTTNPYLGAGSTQASIVTNPVSGPVSMPMPDPYYNPYTGNPYYDPLGSALSGLANLTAARSNSTVTLQRARLLNAEVGMKSIDYRHRIWEEARYERASLMNSEQVRLANIQSVLERARHSPPDAEIWSGQSLNELFNYLASQQGKGVKGQTVAVNEDVLKHINLTTGKDGNVGLLKSEIKWPSSLMRAEFNEPRDRLDKTIPEAVRQAKFGPVGANQVNNVKNDVQKMHEILMRNVGEIPPGQYIEAKRYLNMLDESVRALQDPNVSNYFNDKWTAKGKTAAELIENLTRNGLKFAPAAPGDEWAYKSLYYSLASYDSSVTQLNVKQQ